MNHKYVCHVSFLVVHFEIAVRVRALLAAVITRMLERDSVDCSAFVTLLNGKCDARTLCGSCWAKL